jgi:hypothetical protein
MRLPSLTDHAYFAPGTCFICGGNEGPFVDTGVDIWGEGRFYICTRMCGPLIAAVLPNPADHSPRQQCSAIKADGSPCQALAIPGQELCISHKRKETKDALVAVRG